MSLLSNLRIGAKLGTAFSSVVAIFLAVAVTAGIVTARLKDADHWNVHTYKVLSTGDSMLKAMINMETGTRGFLLAGNDAFLEPYVAGKKAFGEQWDPTRRDAEAARRVHRHLRQHDRHASGRDRRQGEDG